MPPRSSPRSRAARPSKLLFMAGALGEVGVGAAVVALPAEVLGFLPNAAVGGASLAGARMLGIVLIALGLTWWSARREPEGLRSCAVGFLAFNLGVGVLCLLLALPGGRFAAVLWLFAWLHLLTGLGFALGAPVRSASS